MLTTTGPILYDLDPLELRALLDAGRARLVDVREADEHRAERIPGARNEPLSEFDADRLRVSGSLPVLYCRSGRRSAEAARALLHAGWSEVHQLAGGIEAWKAAGLPVERATRAPLPLQRQVQIAVGVLILCGVALGALVAPWFYALAGFIGAGLLYAGLSGTCGLALLLARMPWNRRAGAAQSTRSCPSGSCET
jgi:rhodanese-related sulfurtransferase